MSRYLQYLPAILREGDFLGRFLLAFEQVLTGTEPGAINPAKLPPGETGLLGFEQLLDRAHTFLDPSATPAEFLPWLAQWVAVSLRDDWSEDTKRNFLRGIVPLYRKRGTREGIEQVLRLSGDDVRVLDFHDGVGEDVEAREFGLAPRPPHFFGIVLTVSARDPVVLARAVRRVRALANREKPAHTYYALRVRSPAMRINNDPQNNKAFGPGLLVGRTTVLGTVKA